jgi:hypothetical protein
MACYKVLPTTGNQLFMARFAPGPTRYLLSEHQASVYAIQMQKEGKLRPVDFLTLEHLKIHLTAGNFIPASLRTLASDRGVTRPAYSQSVDRLKAVGLVAHCVDPRNGGSCYLLHPGIACYGDARARAFAWKRFREANEAGEQIRQAKGRLRAIDGGLSDAESAPTLESDNHGPEAA